MWAGQADRVTVRRAAPTHRPGIDGLRALAVVAVLLYHGDISWLPAGFLGVDVFFVVSGYLICSLLVEEWADRGRIDLPTFWMRRARRLLPALFALLFVVALLGPLLAHDAAPQLRGDLPAALGYVSNWWQIVRHQSYFATMGRPPLLQHLWSLAVEEQFYLLFPLLLVAGLRVTRGRLGRLATIALGAGALSTIAMGVSWRAGVDPSRVYYRTDTRAVGLCVGVGLALLAPLHRQRTSIARGARNTLDLAGLAGLVGLGLLMHRLTEFSPNLYRGGFAVTAIVSALALIAAGHPATRLSRALGSRPFAWVGKRSYAIYLWHWPVFMLTRPHLDVAMSGWRLLALRMCVSFALADASWRLVEQPWRTGAAQRAWRALSLAGRRRWAATGVTAAALVLPGLLLIHGPAAPRLLAGPSTTATTLADLGAFTDTAGPTTSPVDGGDGPARQQADAPSTDQPATTAPSTSGPPATRAATPPSPARRAPRPPVTVAAGPIAIPDGEVLAVGDSVMLAAKKSLESTFGGRVAVDAAVARQVDAGLDVLQRYRDTGAFEHLSAVVVDLGTNGPMSNAQFDRLAQIVAGARWVVVLNVRVPKRWEGQSNDSIDNGVGRYGNMTLADWYSVSGEPGVLGDDGVHPTPSGAAVFSRLVAQRVAAAPAPPPTTTTTTAPPPSSTTTTAPPPSSTTTTAPPPPSSTTTSSTTSSTTTTTTAG